MPRENIEVNSDSGDNDYKESIGCAWMILALFGGIALCIAALQLSSCHG